MASDPQAAYEQRLLKWPMKACLAERVSFNISLCAFSGAVPCQQAQLWALLKVLHRRRAQGDFGLCQKPAVHRCSQRTAERASGADGTWGSSQRCKRCQFVTPVYMNGNPFCVRVTLQIAFFLTCAPNFGLRGWIKGCCKLLGSCWQFDKTKRINK